MKYEKLAEKINNSKFAGLVQQSQHKKEIFDEKNILRDVASGTNVAEYALPTPNINDQLDIRRANEYYNSHFGADPKEVAGIIDELEKRKPELVYREVSSSWMKPDQIEEVDEFYKDKDVIVEIKKGYVINKGVRYEGYGHPKEYSLEDGMELVQYRKEMNSNKELAKRTFAAVATAVSTIAIAAYTAAIVPAVACWGYILHEMKHEMKKDERIRAIERNAKIIHRPT